MKQLVFGIDVDGVLASFVPAFTELIIGLTGEDRFPHQWRYDPMFPASRNWPAEFGYTPDQISRAWERVRRSPDFWMNLRPLPGLPDALRQLPIGSRIYFVTSRVGSTALLQTQQWIGSHLGALLRPAHEWSVVICDRKASFAFATNLDCYVDDTAHNFRDWLDLPTAGYLITTSRNYNEAIPEKVTRVHSLMEALRHFLYLRKDMV